MKILMSNMDQKKTNKFKKENKKRYLRSNS